MKYIATALLVLMTITFIVCGILLWKRRKEPNDHSRTIQALFCWVSALFATTFIFRTWAGTTTADGAFLEPLESSSQPIGVSAYQLSKLIPEQFKSSLPSIEELETILENDHLMADK